MKTKIILIMSLMFAGTAFSQGQATSAIGLIRPAGTKTKTQNTVARAAAFMQTDKGYPYTKVKTRKTEVTASNFKDPYYVANQHPKERLFKKGYKRAHRDKKYYTNGNLKEVWYEYRLRNGNMFLYCRKEYYPNGRLKFDKYENPFTPKHEGYENKFYENGQLKSTIWREGHIYAGNWYCFYDNGQLASYGYYIGPLNSGQETGLWKYYYKNGQIKEIGRYKFNATKTNRYARSTKTGEWKYYNEYGELIKTENH